jgi:quinoprotein glucose dehydrogenase
MRSAEAGPLTRSLVRLFGSVVALIGLVLANNGGAVVTAGALVFISAATDDLIRAIDLRSGKTVWQDKLPGGGQAAPMTYAAGGRQYLVIMAGGHHFMETPVSDALVAYALPANP